MSGDKLGKMEQNLDNSVEELAQGCGNFKSVFVCTYGSKMLQETVYNCLECPYYSPKPL